MRIEHEHFARARERAKDHEKILAALPWQSLGPDREDVRAQAVKGVDAGATLRIDLATHRIEVDSTKLDASRLQDAIADAGYTPVPA